MSEGGSNVEQKFWRIFRRVLNVDHDSGTVTQDDTEEWDSLKHVELVFELEEAFELDISPEDIVSLYSNTDIVLAYLHQRAGGQN